MSIPRRRLVRPAVATPSIDRQRRVQKLRSRLEKERIALTRWQKALDEAKPKLVDGKFTFDPAKVRAREEAMVRNVFSRGPVAVIILGGSHDLSRLLDGNCRYVLVTVIYAKIGWAD